MNPSLLTVPASTACLPVFPASTTRINPNTIKGVPIPTNRLGRSPRKAIPSANANKGCNDAQGAALEAPTQLMAVFIRILAPGYASAPITANQAKLMGWSALISCGFNNTARVVMRIAPESTVRKVAVGGETRRVPIRMRTIPLRTHMPPRTRRPPLRPSNTSPVWKVVAETSKWRKGMDPEGTARPILQPIATPAYCGPRPSNARPSSAC